VELPKTHAITFGKWTLLRWPDATGKTLLDLKARPLYVDTRLKECTTGIAHDLTERLFVVRRVFRVNDSLPEETSVRWQWAARRVAAGRSGERKSVAAELA
jgi:hypothetical protein